MKRAHLKAPSKLAKRQRDGNKFSRLIRNGRAGLTKRTIGRRKYPFFEMVSHITVKPSAPDDLVAQFIAAIPRDAIRKGIGRPVPI